MRTVETLGSTTRHIANKDCTSTMYLTIPIDGYKPVVLTRKEIGGVSTYVDRLFRRTRLSISTNSIKRSNSRTSLYLELTRKQLDHISNILNEQVASDGFIDLLHYMSDPLEVNNILNRIKLKEY